MENNICIIPARKGSKRVPNKNFKKLLGKPIIEYAIETAFKCNFDEIIVSSDDWDGFKEIIYKNIPLPEYMQRSEKNSNDNAILYDVVKEVLAHKNITKGHVCILYPTAALVTKTQILMCRELLNRHDCAFPIIKTGNHHEKILTVFGERADFKYPQFELTQSQICSEIYVHSGTFFYCDIEKLLKQKKIIMNDCGHIVLRPWEAIEVDTEDDWKMLEILMQHKRMIETMQNDNFYRL